MRSKNNRVSDNDSFTKEYKINGYVFYVYSGDLWLLRRQLGGIKPIPMLYTIDDKQVVILPSQSIEKWETEMVDFTVHHWAYFWIYHLHDRSLKNMCNADIFAALRMGCPSSIIRNIYNATMESMDENFGWLFRMWFLFWDKRVLDKREESLALYLRKQGRG